MSAGRWKRATSPEEHGQLMDPLARSNCSDKGYLRAEAETPEISGIKSTPRYTPDAHEIETFRADAAPAQPKLTPAMIPRLGPTFPLLCSLLSALTRSTRMHVRLSVSVRVRSTFVSFPCRLLCS